MRTSGSRYIPPGPEGLKPEEGDRDGALWADGLMGEEGLGEPVGPPGAL